MAQKKITAYKVFDKDLKCRGLQYEIGKTHQQKGEISLCENGLHACTKAVDCFKYWSFNPDNRVCIVELFGDMDGPENGDTKIAAEKLKVVRELSWHDVLDIVNTGKGNIGFRNSGDRNSGDRNSGYWNSGDGNSGYWNSGDGNSGDGNSGYGNSGYWNSGYWNSGYWNSGDGNSGYWNSCNYSSGVFNTEDKPLYFFNKPSNWYMKDWLESEAKSILDKMQLTKWINENDMSDGEKRNNPDFYVRKGYLKVYGYKEAFKKMWDELSEEKRNIIKDLPNFDSDIFEEITGVNIKNKKG